MSNDIGEIDMTSEYPTNRKPVLYWVVLAAMFVGLTAALLG